MRVFKPLQISLQTRTFQWKNKNYLSVSYLLGFQFGDTPEVILEQDLWMFLADYMSNTVLDAGMPKPQSEVIVFGDYFAPGGTPVTADRVEVLVGDLHKSLAVIGERYWRPLIGPTPPEQFRQMPIDYQHAFGGKDYAFNHIGKGIEEVDVFGEMRLPLPNIENPDRLISSSGQRPEPAGLAPLDMMWQQRASKMGTYDENWQINHFPGYPPDLDWTHFMCAPKDQWLDNFWTGDEKFSILNMHPDKPQIQGKLPAFSARCFIEDIEKSRFEEVEMKAETLFLFPDAETGVLLYRGTIEVEQADGTDIDHLLVAYEDLSQSQRSQAYYEQALRNRLDEKQVFKYMMNTKDIIPDSERCGFAIMLAKVGGDTESALSQNLESKAESLLEEQKQLLKQKLEASGIDPAPYMAKFDSANKQDVDDPEMKAIMETIEKLLPDATSGDSKKTQMTDIDFSQFDVLEKQMLAMVDSKKQDAKNQLQQTIEQAKGSDQETQVREKLEKAILKIDALPDLPRPSGQEIIDRLRQQAAEFEKVTATMRANGAVEENIPKQAINVEDTCQKIQMAFEQSKEGYRMGAHFVDGSPPHVVPLDIVKHRFIRSIEKGESVAGCDLSGLNLSGMDFSNMDFSGCYLEYANLSGADFSGARLDSAIITHANLSNTKFIGASLKNVNLGGCKMSGADLTDAITTGAELSKSDLDGAKIINCDLQNSNFIETRFAGANLSGSNLSKSNFIELEFQGANFSGCNLSGCNFVKCKMVQVDFSDVVLDEANFVECMCDSSTFKQSRMTNVRFVGGCSIRHCNFDKTIIDKANFRDTEADHSSFEKSSFFMADFGGANLQHTKFYGAIGKRAAFMKSDLMEADFSSVNIMEGSLMNARLTNADLRHSNLYAVEFLGATLGGTDLSGANLDMSKLQDWRPSP